VSKHQAAMLIAATLSVLPCAAAGASESRMHSASQRPVRELDLLLGRLDGRELLSKRVAEVTASLGRPQHRIATKKLYVLRYGSLPLRTGRWSLTITFRPQGGVLRSTLLAFAGRSLAERRLGTVLRLTPREFERRLLREYGDHYQVIEPYRCRTRPLRCRGEVVGQENGLTVGYGLLFPRRPESRYITVYLSRR
jgi:hypothetical protein